MKNDQVEKTTCCTQEDFELAKRKKQKTQDSELSPIEVSRSQDDSILSFSSHSTPMNHKKKEKFNCQALISQNGTNNKVFDI